MSSSGSNNNAAALLPVRGKVSIPPSPSSASSTSCKVLRATLRSLFLLLLGLPREPAASTKTPSSTSSRSSSPSSRRSFSPNAAPVKSSWSGPSRGGNVARSRRNGFASVSWEPPQATRNQQSASRGWTIQRTCSTVASEGMRTARFDHTEPRNRLAHHRPLELCSQPQPRPRPRPRPTTITSAISSSSSQRKPLHRPFSFQLHNLLNPFLVLPLEAQILPQFGLAQDLSTPRDRGRE